MNARTLQDAAEALGKAAERFDAMIGRRRADSAAGNYAAQLKAAELNNEQFDQIIGRIQADRSITAEDMREVFREYRGYEPKRSKGRAALLQDIVNWQMVRARNTARGNNIGKNAGKSW
jgi:hypothetical protein